MAGRPYDPLAASREREAYRKILGDPKKRRREKEKGKPKRSRKYDVPIPPTYKRRPTLEDAPREGAGFFGGLDLPDVDLPDIAGLISAIPGRRGTNLAARPSRKPKTTKKKKGKEEEKSVGGFFGNVWKGVSAMPGDVADFATMFGGAVKSDATKGVGVSGSLWWGVDQMIAGDLGSRAPWKYKELPKEQQRGMVDRLAEQIIKGTVADIKTAFGAEGADEARDFWYSNPLGAASAALVVGGPASRIGSAGRIAARIKRLNPEMSMRDAIVAGAAESYRPGVTGIGKAAGGAQRAIPTRPTARHPIGRAAQGLADITSKALPEHVPFSETRRVAYAGGRKVRLDRKRRNGAVLEHVRPLAKYINHGFLPTKEFVGRAGRRGRASYNLRRGRDAAVFAALQGDRTTHPLEAVRAALADTDSQLKSGVRQGGDGDAGDLHVDDLPGQEVFVEGQKGRITEVSDDENRVTVELEDGRTARVSVHDARLIEGEDRVSVPLSEWERRKLAERRHQLKTALDELETDDAAFGRFQQAITAAERLAEKNEELGRKWATDVDHFDEVGIRRRDLMLNRWKRDRLAEEGDTALSSPERRRFVEETTKRFGREESSHLTSVADAIARSVNPDSPGEWWAKRLAETTSESYENFRKRAASGAFQEAGPRRGLVVPRALGPPIRGTGAWRERDLPSGGVSGKSPWLYGVTPRGDGQVDAWTPNEGWVQYEPRALERQWDDMHIGQHGSVRAPDGSIRLADAEIVGYDITNAEAPMLHLRTEDGEVVYFPVNEFVRHPGEAVPETESIFYSKAQKVVDDKMPPKATMRQVEALFEKNGVKKEEIEWMGLELLDAQHPGQSIPKEAVQEHLSNSLNSLNLDEMVYSSLSSRHPDRWGPNSGHSSDGLIIRDPTHDEPYHELVMIMPPGVGMRYTTGHWSQLENPIFHIRFHEIWDNEGKRAILIDELQSDWHRQGRGGGYSRPVPPEVQAVVDRHQHQVERAQRMKNKLIGDDSEWSIRNTVVEIPRRYRGTLDTDELAEFDNLYAHQGSQSTFGAIWWRENPEVRAKIEEFHPGFGEMVAKHDKITRVTELMDKAARLRDEAGADYAGSVPDVPFKGGAWMGLAMKRMMRWAADDPDIERIYWTRGHEHMVRYDKIDDLPVDRSGSIDENDYSFPRASTSEQYGEYIPKSAQYMQPPLSHAPTVRERTRELDARRGEYNVRLAELHKQLETMPTGVARAHLVADVNEVQAERALVVEELNKLNYRDPDLPISAEGEVFPPEMTRPMSETTPRQIEIDWDNIDGDHAGDNYVFLESEGRYARVVEDDGESATVELLSPEREPAQVSIDYTGPTGEGGWGEGWYEVSVFDRYGEHMFSHSLNADMRPDGFNAKEFFGTIQDSSTPGMGTEKMYPPGSRQYDALEVLKDGEWGDELGRNLYSNESYEVDDYAYQEAISEAHGGAGDLEAIRDHDSGLDPAKSHLGSYDRMLPSITDKILKPYKQKATMREEAYTGRYSTEGGGTISEDGPMHAWGFDFTPEMRADVKAGQSLFQRQPAWDKLPRGAMELLSGDINNPGKTAIRLFEDADVSTVLHELGHVGLHDLPAESLGTIERHLAAGRSFRAGEWTETDHERFARSFERYFLSGESPNRELALPYNKLKEWMKRIYFIAKNNEAIPVHDEVRNVFDQMLAPPSSRARAYVPHTGQFDSEVSQFLGGVRMPAGGNVLGVPQRHRKAFPKQRNREVLWESGMVASSTTPLISQLFRRLKFDETMEVRRDAYAEAHPIDAQTQIPENAILVRNPAKPPEKITERTRAATKMGEREFDRLDNPLVEDDPVGSLSGIEQLKNESFTTPGAGSYWETDYGNVRWIEPEKIKGVLEDVFPSAPRGRVAASIGAANAMTRMAQIYLRPFRYVLGNLPANVILLGLTNPSMLGKAFGTYAATALTPIFRSIGKGPVGLRNRNPALYQKIKTEGGDVQAQAGLPEFYTEANNWAQRSEKNLNKLSGQVAEKLGEITDQPFRVASWQGWARRYGFRNEKEWELLLTDVDDLRKMGMPEEMVERAGRVRDEVSQRVREDMIDFDTLTPKERQGIARYFYLWAFTRGFVKWPATFVREYPERAALGIVASQASRDEERDIPADMLSSRDASRSRGFDFSALNPISGGVEALQDIASLSSGDVGPVLGRLSPTLKAVFGEGRPQTRQEWGEEAANIYVPPAIGQFIPGTSAAERRKEGGILKTGVEWGRFEVPEFSPRVKKDREKDWAKIAGNYNLIGGAGIPTDDLTKSFRSYWIAKELQGRLEFGIAKRQGGRKLTPQEKALTLAAAYGQVYGGDRPSPQEILDADDVAVEAYNEQLEKIMFSLRERINERGGQVKAAYKARGLPVPGA